MNIAIIPARGGSKRIHRKNIRDFLGKPIVAYSIQAALQSDLFDEVMVSTDDVEIATIAEKYGASVPFLRSDKNSDDYATTVDVIHEVLLDYHIKLDKQFDYGCCLYPTAPLVSVDDIKSGLALLLEKNYDTVFSAVAFSYPVWRGFKVNSNGKIDVVSPEYLNARSQDLPQIFHDAGQWYWFNCKRLEKSLFTDNTGVVQLSEEVVQDIDSLTDWRLAELKFLLRYGSP